MSLILHSAQEQISFQLLPGIESPELHHPSSSKSCGCEEKSSGKLLVAKSVLSAVARPPSTNSVQCTTFGLCSYASQESHGMPYIFLEWF